ncbi:MAG TPA: ribosomal protein S18-alanine N-acetyltransferase [Gemmatimonadales bacterium]|jgi:ribosomal-protein-alanine N-acetyltransferase
MAEACQLRPASRADLGALAELERAAFSDPWTEEQLREAMSWPGAILIAADDETGLAGYVLARVVVDEGEILSIGTTPERRRRGIARRLLAAVLEKMRAAGARSAWLEVRVSNDAARTLYQSMGFVNAGVRPDYYRRPLEDALILRLDLDEAASAGSDLRSRATSGADGSIRLPAPQEHFESNHPGARHEQEPQQSHPDRQPRRRS